MEQNIEKLNCVGTREFAQTLRFCEKNMPLSRFIIRVFKYGGQVHL
jgi:hypothetical protein